jgi:hypothetical protein
LKKTIIFFFNKKEFLMFFIGEKNENKEVNFSDLSEQDKKIVESAYKAYYDTSEGKAWRNEQGQPSPVVDPVTGEPISIDSDIQTLIANNRHHTVNGWVNFASFINSQEKPTLDITKEAFEKAYKPAAGDKNYVGEKIPEFNELLEIQQNSWLAAATAAYQAKLELQPVSTSPTP